MSKIHRLRQVAKYGWQHAGQISQESFEGKKRIALFYDIFCCYRKYGMWSNQYLKERMWELDKAKREEIGNKYGDANKKREVWLRDFYANRKFYMKYGNIKYEKESLRAKRNEAYTKRYHAGKNLFVENDVNISRQHYLDGTISIGDNVLLAKHVFIDYTGDVVIGDHVKIANGVNIESHSHTSNGLSTDSASKTTVPTKIVIEDRVSIGAHSIILETCNKIGRGARIGAGSVVRCDIPPYAVVTGNPAKIVGFVFSPSILEEFEEEKYPPEKRISIEDYEANYKKYYLDRLSAIKDHISL